MICNIDNIYNILNDFVSNLQKIFSIEEIDKILSQLFYDTDHIRMNNLNDYYLDDDNNEEPRFSDKFVDNIEIEVIKYSNIDSIRIFMYDEEHRIPCMPRMDSSYIY
jgi:hypothetical protein